MADKIDDLVKGIQDKRMAEFYRKGLKMLAAASDSSPATAIAPKSPEWASWERYFEALGCEPVQMKMVRWGQAETMTMPTQWPEWFDSAYAAKASAA